MPDDTAFWIEIRRALLNVAKAIEDHKIKPQKSDGDTKRTWQSVKDEAVMASATNGYSEFKTTPGRK